MVIPESESSSSSSSIKPRFLNSLAMMARLLSDISRYGSVPRENLLIVMTLCFRLDSTRSLSLFLSHSRRQQDDSTVWRPLRLPRSHATISIPNTVERCRMIRSDARLLSISMRRHAGLNLANNARRQWTGADSFHNNHKPNYPVYPTPCPRPPTSQFRFLVCTMTYKRLVDDTE